MNKEWLTQTACELGRGIAAGQIDPVALTETYLHAIKTHPFRDRIYSAVTADRARTEAKAAKARAESQSRRSLLDGVPISWKDLFDTSGTKTEAGSALLKYRIPKTDALVLKRATHAGLVCLGKTHMSELAFSGLGLNPVTQTPPNVNNHEAISGGSSSGAAASVAFGLAAAGIGSDTGGSVRIPSAWNDLVGLKTTTGNLPLDGVVPLCLKFDTIGPLTRSVEDAAHLYAIMADLPEPDLTPATAKGLRLGVLTTIVKEDLAENPKAAFDTAQSKLAAAGATLTEFDFPALQTAYDLAVCLFTYEAYQQWKEEIEANPDLMFPEILKRFRAGAKFSAKEYQNAVTQLDQIRREYANITDTFDAIIMASSPIMPPNLERLLTDSDYYISANLMALRNTRVANLMGLCALSLPTKFASCGLMICCSPMAEASLINIGIEIEGLINN